MNSQTTPCVANPAEAAPEPGRWPRWFFFLFLVALWTLPGLLYTVQIYEIGKGEEQYTTSFVDAMVHALPVWWVWVLATPVVIFMSRRFPIRRSRAIREVGIHLGAAIVTALVIAAFTALWFSITPPFDTRDRTWSAWMEALLLSTTLHLYFWCYWLIVAAVHFFDHERRLREHEVRVARLDALAAESRMQVLTNQLQPHFLFNALNGLSTLILRGDNRAAQSMLESLASFLRASLRVGEARLVPLRDELELVFQYLKVENVRWADRLDVRTEIEADAERALVPTLLLQPLVENAVRHGIGRSEAGGEIIIRAARADGELRLEVENDGSGLSPGWQERAGQQVGLANTRRRLSLLFEDRHELRLEELDSGRVRLELLMPFALAAEEDRLGAGQVRESPVDGG